MGQGKKAWWEGTEGLPLPQGRRREAVLCEIDSKEGRQEGEKRCATRGKTPTGAQLTQGIEAFRQEKKVQCALKKRRAGREREKGGKKNLQKRGMLKKKCGNSYHVRKFCVGGD